MLINEENGLPENARALAHVRKRTHTNVKDKSDEQMRRE